MNDILTMIKRAPLSCMHIVLLPGAAFSNLPASYPYLSELAPPTIPTIAVRRCVSAISRITSLATLAMSCRPSAHLHA